MDLNMLVTDNHRDGSKDGDRVMHFDKIREESKKREKR